MKDEILKWRRNFSKLFEQPSRFITRLFRKKSEIMPRSETLEKTLENQINLLRGQLSTKKLNKTDFHKKSVMYT